MGKVENLFSGLWLLWGCHRDHEILLERAFDTGSRILWKWRQSWGLVEETLWERIEETFEWIVWLWEARREERIWEVSKVRRKDNIWIRWVVKVSPDIWMQNWSTKEPVGTEWLLNKLILMPCVLGNGKTVTNSYIVRKLRKRCVVIWLNVHRSLVDWQVDVVPQDWNCKQSIRWESLVKSRMREDEGFQT